MNKSDEIISRLQAQQPELSGADELTDSIMHRLSELPEDETTTTCRPMRRHAVAAGIAVIFCLSVAAATICRFVPKATEGENTMETVAAEETPNPDFFVFDNVEMMKVAETLANHYRLQLVFENEAIKQKRIYMKVNKKKTIEEVAGQLNQFDGITVAVRDGKLIIK